MAPTSDPGRLLLIPDVGIDGGLGHLQRSLALGEVWSDVGGDTAVLVPEDQADVIDRIVAAGATPVRVASAAAVTPDAVATAASGRSWCVLDGYDFGADHQAAARAADHVAVIDDHGRTGVTSVDVVIDHNPGATVGRYADVGAMVLAGASYTLLRSAHRLVEPAPHPDRLLVVMGGSPDPATTAFVHEVMAELDVPAEHIDVVGLPAAGESHGARHMGRDDALAPVFASARVALSAAGSTVWELAAAGTAMVLVAVAANQVSVGEAAVEAGIGRYLGYRDDVSPSDVAMAVNSLWADRRAVSEMAARGRDLIDGRGPTRVVAALRSVTVPLRPAVSDDARQLWVWANDRRVREMAFHSEPIAWDDHVDWFQRRLVDDVTRIYVADDGQAEAWGQVRFDRVADGEVEIGVSIDPRYRGRGLAAPLLVAATDRLRADCVEVDRVRARVKVVNQASARAFWSAGFLPVETVDEVIVYEWEYDG